jgi:hypothetical protein
MFKKVLYFATKYLEIIEMQWKMLLAKERKLVLAKMLLVLERKLDLVLLG